MVEFSLKDYLGPSSLRLIEQEYNFTDGIDGHAANVAGWVKDIA